MKHLKTLGLVAAAAMASMAAIGAGTSSATVLYDSGGILGVGRTLDFSIPASSSTSLVDTEGGELDKCTSGTVKGTILGSGGVVSGPTIDNLYAVKGGWNFGLTWGSCTFPTSTTTPGKIEIDYTTGNNGTVTADATIEVTINTIFFGSCIYGATAGTSLGDILGGNPAYFVANAVVEKFSGSNLACPSTAKWTGTYVSTEPAGTLDVKKS